MAGDIVKQLRDTRYIGQLEMRQTAVDEIEQLRSVFEAAYGLCMGYDWNNGTAARDCGYRRKLLSAVNAIRDVPDFENKYRSPPVSRPNGETP